ncbi:MAG: phosphoglucomutase/phosphomannomutase family protein [Dehalococcoidia bacterium]|nr:phosphoglucomutase/phosphomannomutase family protein [Dehalococcoidia bacterium]
MTIQFGTDGWRGVIAQDFTFEGVRACAQATADYLQQGGRAGQGVVIGYDTRFASEDFAAAAAEVLAANGVKAFLCSRPTPTPVTVFGLLEKAAGAAIIITASHNPHRYNGFKLREHDGTALSPKAASRIEALASAALAQSTPPLPLAEATSRGLVELYDPRSTYQTRLASLVDVERLRRNSLKVVVDPMYGAGLGYLSELLSGGQIQLSHIHQECNPNFPGLSPEPIAPNLTPLGAAVRRRHASMGLATDGDADRVGVVDENGQPLSAPEVFSLLALYYLEFRGQRGPIIRSLPSTAMLDKLGDSFGIPVSKTPVGFKHIAPLMLSEDALLGGEESGGYGFRGHVPERDGIMASLCFVDMVVTTGKPLSALVDYLYQKVGRHCYKRQDIHFSPSLRDEARQRLVEAYPATLDGVSVDSKDTQDGFYFLMTDGSWLLIRFSGTEPLMRIYAESTLPEQVDRLLASGKRLAGV